MRTIEYAPTTFCDLTGFDTTPVYVRRGQYALSQRKLDNLVRIAKIQKYYQCNPVRFINDFFGIELLDSQAYIIQRTWDCGHALILESRGMGKSTIIDIMLMAKGMLFNNYWSYIASGSGAQAENTFTILERIANDNMDSMINSTGYIFKNEVEIKNASGDGFSHSSNGFSYNLYNGSRNLTLNSNVSRRRGILSDNTRFVLLTVIAPPSSNIRENKVLKETGRLKC